MIEKSKLLNDEEFKRKLRELLSDIEHYAIYDKKRALQLLDELRRMLNAKN